MTAWLQCVGCSERFEIGPMFYGCPACKGTGKTVPLEVAYALPEISAASVRDSAPGLWRWAPLLPAFRAFQRQDRHAEMLPSASTISLSIAERITGNHALRVVYESRGSVVTCTDDETMQAQRLLMREGLALEPASAVALACMRQVASDYAAGETWVVVGSGAALKWGPVIDDFEAQRVFHPDFADIDELSLS